MEDNKATMITAYCSSKLRKNEPN